MPFLLLKDLPRYECLMEASERYPTLDPSAFETFLHLLRTGDSVYSRVDDCLSSLGVSQGRFTVLMLLNRGCRPDGAAPTPAALAEEACVTRATMTGLIDTLVKDLLVVREDDPGDRRAVLVRLTPKGQAFIDAILPDYCERVSAMMKPLSESERKQMVRLMQKVQQGLLAAETAAAESTAPIGVA